MHGLLDRYYIDGDDDDNIFKCVAAQGVNRKLLDAFFAVSLLSFLLGEDRQTIVAFSGKSVLACGWTVYYDTDRQSPEFDEIRRFFKPGATVAPEYLFVKGSRAFVIGMHNGPLTVDGEIDTELHGKINKLRRSLCDIEAVFVLHSSIEGMSMVMTTSHGMWVAAEVDVFTEVFDIGAFKDHLSEQYLDFSAEVHAWIAWNRCGHIPR